MSTATIEELANQYGISRLCHFTPSRNLVHIAAGRVGILSSRSLQGDERAVFNPTDLQRLDGHTGHISCSIEYPNAWYFYKAQAKEALFRDWVVLLIDRKYLWAPGTKFCPRNAAASHGSQVAAGARAFRALYDPAVSGAHGYVWKRGPRHLAPCPTDEQAEVLVPDRILLEDILGVVVRDESQARNEYVRLRYAGVDPAGFRFIVAPVFFDRRALSACIRGGTRPSEVLWEPTIAEGS